MRGRPRTNMSANSTRARGYGHQHQQLRKRVALVVAQGRAVCSRCGEPINPLTDKWDLDHVDGIDKRLGVYRGPAHSSCNRSTRPALPPNDDDKPKRKNRHWHSSTPSQQTSTKNEAKPATNTPAFAVTASPHRQRHAVFCYGNSSDRPGKKSSHTAQICSKPVRQICL